MNLNLLKIRLFYLFLMTCCVLGYSPRILAARTSEVQELKAQVDNLVSTNQKNYQDVARAMSLLTQIQQEFQSIRGTLDASKYIQQESDKVYQDLDLRVSALEDKVDQILKLVKEMKTPAPVADKNQPPSSAREFEEFQSFLNLINAQDFNAAASGFLGFLKKYPQSQYAGSAQYWTAESFYSLGDYVKAVSEFQKLSDQYPQHPKVKEAVYKQGLSFMRLKKYAEAKLFFQKVMAMAPNSPEALQSKAHLLRIEELEKISASVATNQPVPSGGESSANPALKPVSPPPGVPASNPLPAPNPLPLALPQPPEGERPAPANSNVPLF